jgi:hypothetical protein
MSPPLGFDTRTVQPVASRYIDYGMPAFFKHSMFTNNKLSRKTRNAWKLLKYCVGEGWRAAGTIAREMKKY